jgi:hypothetical protein
MAEFFQFEADFVESLRCIPMQVRFKLDSCGIKLKLAQWHQFSAADRQALVDRPCPSATETQQYRTFLQQLIATHTGTAAVDLPVEPHPAWHNLAAIPETVQAKAQTLQVELHLEQWVALTPLQRFALIKLSRSGHENSNFLPALQEFNLIPSNAGSSVAH